MSPVYVLCPHCEFPAVVGALDRSLPRYCRQCRCVYVPEKTLQAATGRARRNGHGKARQPVSHQVIEPGNAEKETPKKRRRLVAIKALLQQRSGRAV